MSKILLETFNNMRCYPIIEVNLKDYELSKEDEYQIYNISADSNGLYCNDIFIPWDEHFSLDEHLSCLVDEIIERLYNEKEDH